MHCSRVISALMACVEIRLCVALHVNSALGGFVINAVRIGSVVPCVCIHRFGLWVQFVLLPALLPVFYFVSDADAYAECS